MAKQRFEKPHITTNIPREVMNQVKKAVNKKGSGWLNPSQFIVYSIRKQLEAEK